MATVTCHRMILSDRLVRVPVYAVHFTQTLSHCMNFDTCVGGLQLWWFCND